MGGSVGGFPLYLPQPICNSGRFTAKHVALNRLKAEVSLQVNVDHECSSKEGVCHPSIPTLTAFQTLAEQYNITRNRLRNRRNLCIVRGKLLQQTDGSPPCKRWSDEQLATMSELLIGARKQIQDLTVQCLKSWRGSEEKSQDQALLSSTAKCINRAIIARLSAKQGQQEELKKAIQEIKEAEQNIRLDLPPNYNTADKILFTTGGIVNSLSFFVNKVVPAALFNIFNLLLVLIKGGTLLHTEIVSKRTEVEKTLKEDILVPLTQSLANIEMLPSTINSAVHDATAQAFKKEITPAVDYLSNSLTSSSQAIYQNTAAVNTAAERLAALEEENKQLREQLAKLTASQEQTNLLLAQLLKQNSEAVEKKA